jgi:hypothetical protein
MGDTAAEFSLVVLMGPADLLDDSVVPESLGLMWKPAETAATAAVAKGGETRRLP